MAEPFRSGRVGGVEGLLAQCTDVAGGAVVNRGGGVQPDPGVAVFVVVVAEEPLAERARVGQRTETPGEDGRVLEGLEVGLAVRVVVGHPGPGVGAGHAQIDQQLRDWLGGHRGAPVGVDHLRHTVHAHGLLKHLLGQV